MKEYIKSQLEKCRYATFSNYDEATRTYIIPKYSKPTYQIGKSYLVRIPASVLNNKTSVYATNWNNGNCPTHEHMKVYVSKALGRMVYVDGLAYDFAEKKDLSDMWSGWLPADELEQLLVL